MSLLAIYTHASSPGVAAPLPELITSDAALIAAELAPRGVRFQRWEASAQLPPGADQTQILSAYAADVARVQQQGAYPTVDAIRLEPNHPDRAALRQKFLAEHTHSEDEVRFFVEGQGWVAAFTGDPIASRYPLLDELMDGR